MLDTVAKMEQSWSINEAKSYFVNWIVHLVMCVCACMCVHVHAHVCYACMWRQEDTFRSWDLPSTPRHGFFVVGATYSKFARILLFLLPVWPEVHWNSRCVLLCETYVASGFSNPSSHASVMSTLHTDLFPWLWSLVLLLIFAIHYLIFWTTLWKWRENSNSVRCLEWDGMYPRLAPPFLVAVTNREGRTLSRRYERDKGEQWRAGRGQTALERSSCFFPHEAFTSTMFHRDLFSLSGNDMKLFGVGWVRNMGALGYHFASMGWTRFVSCSHSGNVY